MDVPLPRQMLDAINNSNKIKIEEILALGIDINKECTIQSFQRTTFLVTAIRHKHEEIVSMLLDAGADINQGIREVCVSPIACAAADNNLPMVQLLLRRGCNVNSKPENITAVRARNTALHFAILNSNTKMAEVLLAHGHEVNKPMAYPPVIDSIHHSQPKIVEFIVNELGYNPNAIYNMHPITQAILFPMMNEQARVQVVEALLNCEKLSLSWQGRSHLLSILMQLSKVHSSTVIAEVLIKSGSDVLHHPPRGTSIYYQWMYPRMTGVQFQFVFPFAALLPFIQCLIKHDMVPTLTETEYLIELWSSTESINRAKLCRCINDASTQPLSLQQLSRRTIRVCVGTYPKRKIWQLLLPQSLKMYAAFEEEAENVETK